MRAAGPKRRIRSVKPNTRAPGQLPPQNVGASLLAIVPAQPFGGHPARKHPEGRASLSGNPRPRSTRRPSRASSLLQFRARADRIPENSPIPLDHNRLCRPLHRLPDTRINTPHPTPRHAAIFALNAPDLPPVHTHVIHRLYTSSSGRLITIQQFVVVSVDRPRGGSYTFITGREDLAARPASGARPLSARVAGGSRRTATPTYERPRTG